MKIRFVVGGLPIEPLSNLDEINKAEKAKKIVDGTETIVDALERLTFSEESYWKIRCLEINNEFEPEILRARKLLGIPENGFTYDEYLKKYSPFALGIISSKNKRIDNEITSILTKFHCDDFIKTQLKSILLANIALPIESNGWKRSGISVYSTLDEDDLNRQDFDSSEKALFIKITSSVKPEAIINFIEKNKDKFNSLLNNLPKSRGYTELSEEKISILGMKKNNKKVKYSQMANLWADLCCEKQEKVKDKEIKTDTAFGQYYRRTVIDLFYRK